MDEPPKKRILRNIAKEAWYTGFFNARCNPPLKIKRRGRPKKKITTFEQELNAYLGGYLRGETARTEGKLSSKGNPYSLDNIKENKQME